MTPRRASSDVAPRAAAAWALLVAALASACAREPRRAAPGGADGVRAAAAVDAGAPADAGDACVERCVADSQMRATSPAAIERECQVVCGAASPP